MNGLFSKLACCVAYYEIRGVLFTAIISLFFGGGGGVTWWFRYTQLSAFSLVPCLSLQERPVLFFTFLFQSKYSTKPALLQLRCKRVCIKITFKKTARCRGIRSAGNVHGIWGDMSAECKQAHMHARQPASLDVNNAFSTQLYSWSILIPWFYCCFWEPQTPNLILMQSCQVKMSACRHLCLSVSWV